VLPEDDHPDDIPESGSAWLLTTYPLRWRLLSVWVAVAGGAGAVWGGIRGTQYWPTFPAALVEGCLLFAVPAVIVGLLALGVLTATRTARRRR